MAPCESALHFVKSREVRQNIMGSLSLGPGFHTGQVLSTHPWRCAGLYTEGRPVCPSSIAPGTVGLEVMAQGGPGSRTLDLCALDAKAGQLRTGGLGPAPQSARRWPPTQPPSGCLLVSRVHVCKVRRCQATDSWWKVWERDSGWTSAGGRRAGSPPGGAPVKRSRRCRRELREAAADAALAHPFPWSGRKSQLMLRHCGSRGQLPGCGVPC